MAVQEQTPYIEHIANGVTTSFALGFVCDSADNLVVTINDLPTNVGDWSYIEGNVIFQYPPLSESIIKILRNSPLARSTTFKTYDNSLNPNSLNLDLDKIWLVMQELHVKNSFSDIKLQELLDALVEGNINGLPAEVLARIAGDENTKILVNLEANRAYQAEIAINNRVDNEALIANQNILAEKHRAEEAEQNLLVQINTVGVGNKAYKTYALMDADKANIPAKSKVTVTNDATASNNGDWQWDGVVFTKSAFDPVEQAKKYTDSYATVKSKTLANTTDFNTLNVEGRYIVPSNASALTMLNCPSPRAGILEVLPISTAITIQRYTPYNIENKVYFRTSNGGVWPATWQELLSKSEADLIYATKTTLSDSISSAMGSVTQSDYYGKKYTTSEVTGSTVYTNGVYVGYNSIYDKDAVFNAIESRIFNSTTGNIEYRIWIGSKVSSGATGYFVNTQATISSPDFSGVCRSFPKSDTGQAQTVVLDKAIAIPKNTPFVIVFKAADLNKFGIAHATSVSGNLENRGFNLVTASNEWSALTAIGNGGVSLGYVQAGFKLLVSLPQSSSGAQPEEYRPTLVLPPKIYAMSGLETHIYPEHLLVEDYELYKHDVTCNRGQQRNRGFVWSPSVSDPTGNYVLSWSLHDKQKGTQLTSASTTIQLAALNAKSGQTVKALVIGDSLVNAGFITQRLLDIAVDDVMKVQLLGTRGTGLNKHEGRGGWKIEDYAGAGRSNYKFTVSGVVTPPAINSTTYTFGTATYLVQEVALTGGSGTIIASLWSGTPPATPSGSGNLTKANTGVGDATIAFSNFEGVPGNPFWNAATSKLDFANYLSYNSLATPDYVFIQLGVNDVFGLTSDQSVVDFTVTAFAQLDSIIAAIKAAMPSAKIAVAASPVGANQDAFGTSYGCGQTAWRYRRNLVTYNKQLYAHYASKEAQSIYVLGSGVGVDTENNFPTTVKAINSHNSKTEDAQSNGVHPDKPGYDQISDGLFPFMKAI